MVLGFLIWLWSLEVFTQEALIFFFILKNTGSFIGYLLLVYSILLVIAAALSVYRLALIKDPADDDKTPTP